MLAEPTLFDLPEDEVAWRPIYKHYSLAELIAGFICRDCGRTKFSWEKSCGGARPGLGSFDLCDDCAALDGRGDRRDGKADCSRWGIRTTDEEAERLTELQHRRRAAYLRKTQVFEPGGTP